MIHSDRGVQYVSQDFRKVLKTHGFIQSMSRKGNCWDNVATECFFRSLKTERLNYQGFANHDEVVHFVQYPLRGKN